MKHMTRVALYARFSSDQQRQTSIADQLRAARARAAAEAWPVVVERSDEGISGATPFALRPGGKALLADALANRFDVLILEGLDRAFRDLGEQELVVKRLEHRGIRIIGTSDGYDTLAKGRKVMRVARGLVNEIYLDDLREKTHRGLAGQFDRGYHVGGVCFGYRSQATPDGRGRELTVDSDQAAIVARIFTEYADGHSVRHICHRLNIDGIASPRGGTWAQSALVGDRKRGAGLLNNELYAGRLVWNRRQWLKDPETGRRRYVDRPRAEWQVREAPHLRIVPDELWQAVRARDRRHPPRAQRSASMRTLFAGLLRCHTCGGPITAIDARRYGCNRHDQRGPVGCANAQAFPRRAVDDALLDVVRSDLLSPAAIAELHQAVRAALASAASSATPKADTARQKALQREVQHLVDAIAQCGLSSALQARLRVAEAELEQLERAHAAAQLPTVSADQVLATFKRQLLNLRESLQRVDDRDRTRALLADIIGPVVLTRDTTGAWAEMEEPVERIALTGSTPLGMVAGARNSSRRRIRIA